MVELERVVKVISVQLGFDANGIKPEMNIIDDLGADSLDLVEVVMALEEEFDIEISDEDAERIHTVGDAHRELQRLVNQ